MFSKFIIAKTCSTLGLPKEPEEMTIFLDFDVADFVKGHILR